jgi:hypothetical protein
MHGDLDKECMHTCIGCGFWSRSVECRGIYYCPNPLCRACGVTNTIVARCRKEGVTIRATSDGYEIDDIDVVRVQRIMVSEITDEALRTFIRTKYPEFVRVVDECTELSKDAAP